MATSSEARITKTPGVCGGKACIAGHRVRVLDVVGWHEDQGMTPEAIVAENPSITVGDVEAALAYYANHTDEIREEMRAEDAFFEEMRREQADRTRFRQILKREGGEPPRPDDVV